MRRLREWRKLRRDRESLRALTENMTAYVVQEITRLREEWAATEERIGDIEDQLRRAVQAATARTHETDEMLEDAEGNRDYWCGRSLRAETSLTLLTDLIHEVGQDDGRDWIEVLFAAARIRDETKLPSKSRYTVRYYDGDTLLWEQEAPVGEAAAYHETPTRIEVMFHGPPDGIPEVLERYTTGTGQVMTVHKENECDGERCPIHNPTDHCMRDFPTHWRGDRGIMERICPHGIGHPDPDDLRVRTVEGEGVHGCDGCCTPGGRGRG